LSSKLSVPGTDIMKMGLGTHGSSKQGQLGAPDAGQAVRGENAPTKVEV